jgi:hypothetical protein
VITADTITDEQMSAPIARALCLVGRGKIAQHAALKTAPSIRILLGILVDRGLARTVKHRDHTRSYALTDAGKRLHPTAVVVAANANTCARSAK